MSVNHDQAKRLQILNMIQTIRDQTNNITNPSIKKIVVTVLFCCFVFVFHSVPCAAFLEFGLQGTVVSTVSDFTTFICCFLGTLLSPCIYILHFPFSLSCVLLVLLDSCL